MKTNRKIILEGIVGSKAYGLDMPESDTDKKGIFIYSTQRILSLWKNPDTIHFDLEDTEHHEVEKFIKLASKCNPTVLELLYLNDYTKLTPEGNLLINNRDAFLSKKIYKTYGGYALAQAKKLYKKGMNFARYEKHARHCFRLLLQAKELLTEHTLTIRLDEEIREELFKLGKSKPETLIEMFEQEFTNFDKIQTTLPDEPNWNKLNEMLLIIREANYEL